MGEYKQTKFIKLVKLMFYAKFFYLDLPKATIALVTRYSLLITFSIADLAIKQKQ
jgi:hypothetical protein